MLPFRRMFRETLRRPGVLLGAGSVLLLAAGTASAAEDAAFQLSARQFPLAHIFTFMFLMLGPFKIIAPFTKLTAGADAALTRKVALRATLLASLGLLVAALIGQSVLSKYQIPIPVLALSAGIILFLVALQNVLQQYQTTPAPIDAGGMDANPLASAMMPLAFPTIVTPYGIAAIIVFLGVSADRQSQLMIGVVVLGIMLLNLIVMLLARRMGSGFRIILPILGAVLGVIQVALGLQIIHNSLRLLWAS